jgi:predicted MPP superfamily phosphohydrolase
LKLFPQKRWGNKNQRGTLLARSFQKLRFPHASGTSQLHLIAMTQPAAPELTAAPQSPVRSLPRARTRPPIAGFIIIIQAILILIHMALYATWTFFWSAPASSGSAAVPVALAILSVSFVAASLAAHRYFNPFVRAVYTLSAAWLGFVNFFFLAAIASWIVYGVPLLFGANLDRRAVGAVCFGFGLLAGIYAVVNASRTRVVRVPVKLPNLPDTWRGRRAAVVSDLHLGHVRNAGFLRRILRKLSRLHPDVLFIPGDMFDGTPLDLDRISKTWSEFSAPLGAYFITGNHEEFTDPKKYLDAIRRSGIRVLENERIVVDGLQVVGVDYRDSTNVERFRSILSRAALDPDVASVLLVHNPNRLPIAAEAGISLQISGHTHLGQFFPWTAVVSRMYGRFAHGLHYLGDLAVYTSSGAGTWGPPMRLGSHSEIVLIEFE